MSRYLVVIEGSRLVFRVCSGPAGVRCDRASPAQVAQLMEEAIPLHIESLRTHGEHVPEPRSEARYVAVS